MGLTLSNSLLYYLPFSLSHARMHGLISFSVLAKISSLSSEYWRMNVEQLSGSLSQSNLQEGVKSISDHVSICKIILVPI